MAKKTAPKSMNVAKMRLATLQKGQFDLMLKSLFGEKVNEVPVEERDLLYQTFCAGWNCGIIQVSGDLLEQLDIKLNITAKDIKKTK